MSFTPINAGGWNNRDPLTSAQLNAFQEQQLQSIDGVGGGTYTLSADLVFDGADIRFLNWVRIEGLSTIEAGATLTVDGELEIAGDLEVLAGGDINVRDGGDIEVFDGGQLNIESGGEINVSGGGTPGVLSVFGLAVIEAAGTLEVDGDVDVKATGEVNVESLGKINVLNGGKIIGSSGGEIRANDSDDFTINACSTVFVVALNPIHVGSQWASEESGTFICATVATANRLVFPLKVPVGDTITTLRMTIDGGAGAGHGSVPTDRPVLELCKVNTNGTLSTIQTVADPVNTNPAYDDPHTVTMSGGLLPYTVTTDRHVVRVIGEGIGGVPGEPNTTRLCSIDGTLLARTVRQTTEVR